MSGEGATEVIQEMKFRYSENPIGLSKGGFMEARESINYHILLASMLIHLLSLPFSLLPTTPILFHPFPLLQFAPHPNPILSIKSKLGLSKNQRYDSLYSQQLLLLMPFGYLN